MASDEALGESGRHAFYQEHLNRVSRSFAYCIEHLDGPLRSQVSLAYLLCRLLDTIEDAPWGSTTEQVKAFELFNRFLYQDPRSSDDLRSDLREWISSFPSEIPDGEKNLIRDSEKIFSDFHALPGALQVLFQSVILSMSAGMREFITRSGEVGKIRLQSMAEVNQYCFFVAGVVGEILTGLVQLGSDLGIEKASLQNISLEDAYRFGFFLQKVNLLKDQRSDENVGRFLVPSRQAVFQSLTQDTRYAYHYLQSLPQELRSFRLFCAWSFFLGLASLPWIERAYNGEVAQAKISREETKFLFDAIEEIIDDPQALDELFNELLSAAELVVNTPDEADEIEISKAKLGKTEPISFALADSALSKERFRQLRFFYLGALSEDSLRSLWSE